MDTIEKMLLAAILTMCFICSFSAIVLTADIQSQMHKLEMRVLVLETRLNIYSGQTSEN